MLEISRQTARRYVLGRQGAWPGRRWQGQAGVEQALRAVQAIQIDPISVVARNHQLALWSRVADFQPAWLDHLLYTERKFFEYGNIMFIYPVEEWPYWLPLMQRSSRWRDWINSEMPTVIEHVRERIAAEGPLSSRDFKDRTRVAGGFNTVKDTSHGLDYLWTTGQILIHSRRGSDRVFELTERMLQFDHAPVTLDEAKDFFLAKALRDTGLASASELARRTGNIVKIGAGTVEMKARLAKMEENGTAARLTVEGRPDTLFYPAAETPLLEQLERGEIPPEWQVVATTTTEEVNLLAPLDNIIWDRARLRSLFDFDYIWEVYKPAPIRRWGYYTMPILYGDRLVAKLDPKLDRKTGRLLVQGFWLDDPTLAEDAAFGRALATGLRRFANFHQATSLDCSLISYPLLKQAVENWEI